MQSSIQNDQCHSSFFLLYQCGKGSNPQHIHYLYYYHNEVNYLPLNPFNACLLPHSLNILYKYDYNTQKLHSSISMQYLSYWYHHAKQIFCTEILNGNGRVMSKIGIYQITLTGPGAGRTFAHWYLRMFDVFEMSKKSFSLLMSFEIAGNDFFQCA